MTIRLNVDMIALYANGLVVIDRLREPFGLALPGGKVDAGELLENAVRRELKEETGLGVSSMKQFRTYADPDRDPRYRALSVVYVCKAYGALRAGSDAKGVCVVGLDEIDSLKDKFAFDHYRILCDYREQTER